MKKNKFLALTVASLIGLGALVGCGGTPTGSSESKGGADNSASESVDNTKVTLNVGTYDGGIGYEWLQDAAERFEDIYGESTQFGKTGVKVSVSYNKDSYNGEQMLDKGLLAKNQDVYLTEGVDYASYVNKGLVADISDVVGGAAYGETVEEDGTIEDKLDEIFKKSLKAIDGKYYMLPFYDGFYGFMYNVDLFEEEGFYFGQSGQFIARAEGESQEEFDARKSAGPNGNPGDYDDGLPATYADFDKLVKQIVNKDVVPFSYSGKYDGYINKACRAFAIDYEGYEGSNINYTLSGTSVALINVDANGNITPYTANISEANGYDLQKQAGRYYALKMEEKYFSTPNYVGGTYNTDDFTVAQGNFVKGIGGKKYAMIADGVWWENEADLTGQANKRFGFLPMPKADGTRLGAPTLFSANRSYCFINKNTDKLALAKEFVRFLHSDAEMTNFTVQTSVPRSLNYEINDEARANATHYGKMVIDIKANSKVVYPYSNVSKIMKNPSTFGADEWYFSAKIEGEVVVNPFSALKDGSMSAEEYFNAMYTYHKGQWDKLR